MSTSTKRRRLRDEMLAAIYELTTVRPHECNSVKLTAAAYRIYSTGYYAGVRMALRVAELAIERARLAVRTRRQARRAKRIA